MGQREKWSTKLTVIKLPIYWTNKFCNNSVYILQAPKSS